MDLAPEDPTIALPAVRALERIYTDRGKGKDLADVLRVRVKLEDSIEIRRELFAQLGTLAEEDLKGRRPRPSSRGSPASRTTPPTTRRSPPSTGSTSGPAITGTSSRCCAPASAAADGAATRKVLMVRAAQTLGDRLADVPEAILAYRSVLDDFGADREILGALSKLYEKAEQWPDLAETLEAELGLVTEDADRIALLTKLGDVRRKRLSEVNEAIEAYRQALTLDPAHAPARAALEELLDDPEARREPAEILRPLYEADGQHAKLVRVLEIQVDHESALEGRLDVYERIVQVTEGPLGEPAKAFAYAARALREAAGDSMVTTWIARTERLTERTNGYADLVELFRNVAPDVLDEDEQVSLTLRIAEIARTKHADAALAKEYYRKALDLRTEETRALVALEELYEEAGEHELLLEILKRRAEVAPDDAAEARDPLQGGRASVTRRSRIAIARSRPTSRSSTSGSMPMPSRRSSASIRRRRAGVISLPSTSVSSATEGTSRERRAALHHALGSRAREGARRARTRLRGVRRSAP